MFQLKLPRHLSWVLWPTGHWYETIWPFWSRTNIAPLEIGFDTRPKWRSPWLATRRSPGLKPHAGNGNMRWWLLENDWLKKPAHDNNQLICDTRSSDQLKQHLIHARGKVVSERNNYRTCIQVIPFHEHISQELNTSGTSPPTGLFLTWLPRTLPHHIHQYMFPAGYLWGNIETLYWAHHACALFDIPQESQDLMIGCEPMYELVPTCWLGLHCLKTFQRCQVFPGRLR